MRINIGFLRNIRKLGLRKKPPLPSKPRVVYLASNLEVLEGHDPYLRALRDSGFFEVHIVWGENQNSDSPSDENILEKSNQSNTLVILSVPYLEKYSEKIQKKLPNFKVVYLGYAPLWSSDRRLHFELDVYSTLSRIFCHSRYELEGFANAGCEKDRLVLIDDKRETLIRKKAFEKADVENVVSLLWTPHWTQDWYGYPFGYSTWLWSTDIILRWAKAHPTKKVILRPHPFFPNMIADRKMRGLLEGSPFDLAAKSYAELQGLENVQMSNSSLVDDLTDASIIVSDFSSAAIYGVKTSANVVVTFNDYGPPVSPLCRLELGATPQFSTKEGLENWLEELENLPRVSVSLESSREKFIKENSPQENLSQTDRFLTEMLGLIKA